MSEALFGHVLQLSTLALPRDFTQNQNYLYLNIIYD